ncbi:MAG: sulfotransferase family 2 domain-containing protein [Pseudomonadota bacterium]
MSFLSSIRARLGTPPPPEDAPPKDAQKTPTMRVFTLSRAPVFYLATTKCGCTYLKNLFYLLEFGHVHPRATYIHQHEAEIPRAGHLSLETVQDSPYGFMVLRDPADRLLSLYFDKIYGEGPQNFPHVRATLARDAGLSLDRALSAQGHQDNVMRLLDWLRRNLAGETKIKPNPHWKPQIERIRIGRKLNLAPLLLERLDEQLPALLSPVLPQIEAQMAKITARNRTERPLKSEAILTDRLRDEIADLYGRDLAAYLRARAEWDMV